MASNLSLKTIEKKLQKAKPEEQKRFLASLPRVLRIAPDEWSFLKTAEPSFEFWNNPYDDRYNDL